MKKAERLALFDLVDIYPVTCGRLSRGRSTIEVLQGCIAGGARIIQLREKDLNDAELYRLAVSFRQLTAAAGMLLMINDRVDIALAVGADGVHLGQNDLPPAAARKIGPELILGRSTHSLAEAVKAQEEGADYLNIGPIFPTKTKDGLSEFLGPEAIARISPHLHIPFTVMGGITQANIDQVLAGGARKVAVVTAITEALDIASVVRELKDTVRNHVPPA